MTRARAALLLLVAALALRLWDFGDPVIHVDEQYYRLVGARMLDGAVPYLDIWDRKPVGLFLLHAGFAALPGDAILAQQLAATLAVWATALAIGAAARLTGAARGGALAAGAVYLVGVSLLGGRGGQAPVFYDLPIAAAALLTLALPRLAERGRAGAIVAGGALACLLAGIAIQLKYTAAVEGAFFGLAHLWFLRRARVAWAGVAAAGLLWLALGLLPTAAAIGWYAHAGALDAWWFANITSIGLRPGYPADQLAMRLLGIGAQLSPLVASAAIGWRWRARRGAAAGAARIALGWALAAGAGFFAIGTFFDHYALPLLAPLAVLAARAFARSARAAVATLGLALTLFAVERAFVARDAAGARAVARVVAANSGRSGGGGCPYVFIGDTATYELAHACLPTRYAFPNLLAYATERGATGTDEAAEVRRILATRPPVIVASDRRLAIWNPASLHAVRRALARDYRPVFAVRRSSWHTWVFLRRDRALRR